MNDHPKTAAYVLLGGLSLIWGTSFILIKQGLKVFTPDEVGSLRVAVASLFLLPMALVHVRKLQPSDYWRLFASGMMGIFIPAFLFAIAQTRMDSSVAGVLNTLTPIFTMIVGAVVFRQRFRPVTIIGILLGFAGTAMLSLSRSGENVTGINTYALLVVLACLLYGSNLNFIKFSIPDLSAPTITSVSLLLIGPLALIYLFGFTNIIDKMATQTGAWRAFGFVALLGFMSTAVATILFNKLVKVSTPMFASSVTYLMPLVVVMWGLIDGEVLLAGQLIGMVAIVAGVYLANRRR